MSDFSITKRRNVRMDGSVTETVTTRRKTLFGTTKVETRTYLVKVPKKAKKKGIFSK